jgi:hypothetical protein
MSIQISNAVWQHSKSTGRARLVLLAIADHQGEIGAWPSMKTIAKMVNASERSVQRDIQILQELGELRVEIQNAPMRQQYKSNLYWVTLPGVTELSSGVTETQSGVTEMASGVTAGGVRTITKPLLEPLHENMLSNFDEFWNAYPKKVDKAKAEKSFRSAVKRAKFDDILAGVISYRSDPTRNPEFTKYPATWLNSDSWDNASQPSNDSEALRRSQERRERDKRASNEYLAQLKMQESQRGLASRCEHDKIVAMCVICSKKLNE